jgi:RNA polymerase sigma-70 factor (ECF subfamily)
LRGSTGSPQPQPTPPSGDTGPAAPPSWFTASDEELIRATAAGRGDAFDEVLARHGRAAFVFINRLLAGRHEAEDLLQETFMRVVQHASEFRAGAPFKPWLYTIARNVAYNALKRAGRRDGLEVKTDLSDWEPPARDNGELDPSIRLEQDEQKRRLLAALERLPQAHREILVLTVFENFSYEEAAEITGDPVGTLRSRVFHALKKLREMLKERP